MALSTPSTNFDMNTHTVESRIHFSGRVQGVGFRYETLKVAKGYEVTGFVQNLTDGRVHLVAQGSKSEVEEFVSAVSEQLSDYIREREETVVPSKVTHRTFEIRR